MLKRLTAVILSAAMALSLTVFPVSAEESSSSTETTAQTFDFRPADNEYITSTSAASEDYTLDTDGNYVIDKSAIWHDDQHGITFSGGDIIKLHVSGPVNITLGGCTYAAATKVKLMNGTDLVDQVDFAKGCLGKTGLAFTEANSMQLSYTGKTAADLTINYDGMAYLPVMVITPISTVMPKDIHWTTLDKDFMDAVAVGDADSKAISEIDRSTEALGSYETKLNGYGKWTAKNNAATYTHTDGTQYSFTQSLNAGLGSATKRSFYFAPQQACIVTVVYASQATRPMYIYQGSKKLAEGEEGKTGTEAAVITADIVDPAAGNVVIYGGSNGKDIYGIFVDYYDPTVEVKHTVAGDITYAGSVDTSALKIVFEDKKDNSKTLVDFDKTNGYSTQLVQYKDYNIYVGNADGAKVDTLAVSLDSNSISVAKQDITHNITVLDVAEADVTGTVKVHDINNDSTSLDLSGVTLKFTDKSNAENVYTAGSIANDGSYTVRIMSGKEYTVTATGATGYDLSPLSQEYTFVAGDPTPFKNILFTEALGTVEFAQTVHVGANKEYARINDAIAAIKKMTRPAGEDGRVTIEIDPGTYTEQVYLDASYVTMKAADPEDKPEIDWYYGIGYIYYSSNGGYYSEDYAVAKTRKSTVDRWGTACCVYGEYVNLENIIFKNTFNCEVTAAELADGVEAAKDNQYSDVNGKPERNTENYDARTKDSATERAAAIAIDKNYCEAYGCEFISSQDTFFTNSIAYIKNCYIEGGTDYIFGGNSVVFDGCTLAWHGYSDKSTGGYITANKNSNATDNGYLFKDCTVSNSKYFTTNTHFAAGSWGRNWGGEKTQVVFDGITMNGADTPGAWVKMGGELSTSILYVNDVTDKTGAAVDVSGTTFNPNGTMTANNYKEMSPEDYFGGWTPPHYVASTEPADPKPDDPEPSTDPAIKTAEKKDGNTYVTLENITDGVVIAVKYNGTAVDSVKTANVSTADAETGIITINGIEADKVMVWKTLEGMEPVCEAKAVTAAETQEPEPPEPDDTVTVTVVQPTGGTVTVYNESEFHSVTADVPDGVTTEQVVANNDYFTLQAPDLVTKMKKGSDSDAAFADNSEITNNYFEIRVSGSDNYPAVYTAKENGYLTAYVRAAANKKVVLKNTTANTTKEYNINETDTSSGTNYYNALKFEVSLGVTYNLYVAGGTGRLYGVKYESTDYPQSTTSLVVDKGDTVRAAVVPSANYVVKGITVDEALHSGREYTFEVNDNVTVSASLEAEPELVETTAVASDAALTREVMGAILYDAYSLASADTKASISKYTAQNGGVPSPDDPNYDPNLQYEGTPYTPLTGWGALTDKNGLDDSLYAKVKAAYNLGLIRTETGIARGSAANGTALEPDTEVTRAKAAKSLVFAWTLTQDPGKASQKIPAGFAPQSPAAITAPNSSAQSTVFTNTVTPASVDTASVSLASADEEAASNTDNAEFNLMANEAITVDFTALSEVPVYTSENGKGFVAKSSAIMPSGSEREVAPVSSITIDATDGAKVTESNGAYLTANKNSDDGDSYNYGGLIYRVDTGAPGLYRLEVTVDGTQSDTRVAPTGMNSGNLTGTKNWDNAGEVPRTSYATWSDSTWTYDFGTGESFIEIEIEPTSLATASATKTVGVKSITITPIDVTAAGDKPTIHILGDSTQKTYTFNETISAWGQTLGNYFDASKVNVVNYSMGGRAMKSNYCEGRFNEILASGKQGDYVFLHSAHNDETISTNRFSRGAGSVADDLTANNANYNKWLDMYVAAIKARGMTPVLVTAMPRVNGSSGAYTENTNKPNGFNPDSPANMRAKAASDSSVGLAELYTGAKAYYDKLDGKEVAYIYNNIEAGETPANNAANGTKGDGTHYKEAAAKQFSRIILQSIYDQSVADTDTYTDKAIMTALVGLMRSDVQTAAASSNHDWSAVFPEMASDVSAVDVVPGAAKQAEANYYYRNNIEKALQLGLLHKDTENLFKPAQTITVGEYARAIEKAFGLAANSLTSYTKTYAELTAE